MSANWSWTMRSGDADLGFTLYTGAELKAAIAGALLACGTEPKEAMTIAKGALEAAWRQRDRRTWKCTTPPWGWSLELPGGNALRIVSNDLPEDLKRLCSGRTEEGNRCPRHLNHLGEC